IQQHEVAWDELDAWLALHDDKAFERPVWVPKLASARAKLPATGVPWEVARAYCKDLGGSLPTEEEWELAARGAERRPNAWAAQAPERGRGLARAAVRDRTVSQVDGAAPPVRRLPLRAAGRGIA